jgi:N-methylhydantoinase A
MSYLVGIDIGGTFTDCAIVDRAGKLLTTKVPSTPQDFARGMMDALDAGAQALGLPLERFCRSIRFLSHGTTVGTNTIIQKKGAKVGLITTLARLRRPRHPQGGALPRDLEAGADRAQAADPRRVGKGGLLRRDRCSPQ